MSKKLKCTIRRDDLRKMVPLADSTIYEMEKRGEFPKRFNLTSRCVVWDQEEVEAWIEARKTAENVDKTPGPDVRKRKTRPVRQLAAA
ncbi:AlpA family phage regulatory protein [Chromobacterium alkanivorans]|uniref:helix-turn-helix transcriptional regulator n=1 Tax=Chromobacterium alkanivorans TaxID=1071719 RepID=UPI0019674B5F|nr:AlpA family phage regulatory protein [Chromobacterium alkanivorans]MBN3005612.1 AlpA family phage regulatory protein [Chromobacterium alkanivorans]